jgi:large subunit ribosomal protein L18
MTRTIRRRRLENKTDYKSRLALLSSEKSRLVIRKTNKYILMQAVSSEIAQDKVILSVSSKDLLLNGWPKDKEGSLKGLVAAYLTGLLFGKKLNGKVKDLILDMGMYRNAKKSRIYSALKGAIDSGLSIPHSASVLPTEEDLKKDEKIVPLLEKLRKELKN